MSRSDDGHLGGVSVFDEDGRICSFSGFATPEEILNAWRNAANLEEWFEKYKDVMFDCGHAFLATDRLSADSIVERFSMLTPWAYMRERLAKEEGQRKQDWQRLSQKLLDFLNPNEPQRLAFGDGDENASPIKKRQGDLVGGWAKDAYQPISLGEVRPRLVMKLLPLDYLARKPWGLSVEEWGWIESNPVSQTQLSFNEDGMREQRPIMARIFARWRVSDVNKEIRRSVLKMVPHVKNRCAGTPLDTEETKQALGLVSKWSESSPSDAAALLSHFRAFELADDVCKNFSGMIAHLTALTERKKLSKIIRRSAVKANKTKTIPAL